MKAVFFLFFCITFLLAQPPWETAITNYIATLEATKWRVSGMTSGQTALRSAWLITALLACAIAAGGVTLVWLVGVVTANESIRRVAKAEGAQTLATLLLVGILFVYDVGGVIFIEAMMNATELFIYRAAYGEAQATGANIYGGPYTPAYLFLKAMAECAENEYMKLYEESKSIQSPANMRMEVTGGTFKIDVGGIVALFLWPGIFHYEYLASEFAWLAFLVYLQINLLRFIETAGLVLFLPVGIALRAFPPTRGAGAVLIAISIGFYFVYPTVYALLALAAPEKIGECAARPKARVTVVQRRCPLGNAVVAQAVQEAVGPKTPEAEKKFSESFKSSGDLRYAVVGYFVISLGATFIFIRSISGILGADISEIGRSMMRLL